MGSPLRNFSITRPDGTLKTAEELQQDANKLLLAAQQRSERIRDQLAANIAEATSRNGAATVAVTATGGLQSVQLTERSRTLTPTAISAAIMEAYQEASRRAVARTAEIAEREGADSRITTMVRDLLPDEPTDEEQR